jgi:hypothetical protein
MKEGAMPRELYRSMNGDVWVLDVDESTGMPVIEHRPNEASGGETSRVSIERFLGGSHLGPEHQKLLSLICKLAASSDDLPDNAGADQASQ